jgi:regulatory protein
VARRSFSRGDRARRPPVGTALDQGLTYLGRRAHSRVELRHKLERKGFETADVESALGRLAELGYLDDAAFARALVRRRSTGRGPRALAAELASKGIDRAGIDSALQESDSSSQLEAATRLAERLYASQAAKARPGPREAFDRIGAKLVRRGFSMEVARAACRAVLASQAQA